MKSLYLPVLMLISTLFSTSVFAQDINKKETIKVWGNCGMCEENIEKAAKKAGAITADWNEETKILAVSYKPATSNSFKIQQAIAAVGYDTQDLKANEKAYQQLHSCCKYDRKPEETKTEGKEVAATHECKGSCCK